MLHRSKGTGTEVTGCTYSKFESLSTSLFTQSYNSLMYCSTVRTPEA